MQEPVFPDGALRHRHFGPLLLVVPCWSIASPSLSALFACGAVPGSFPDLG